MKSVSCETVDLRQAIDLQISLPTDTGYFFLLPDGGRLRLFGGKVGSSGGVICSRILSASVFFFGLRFRRDRPTAAATGRRRIDDVQIKVLAFGERFLDQDAFANAPQNCWR